VRYIIDCDPGHDDAVAILLAASALDISGITTVYGNASVESTTRNALDFLDLAGLGIPVYRGSEAPLRRPRTHANVHGRSGLDGAELPLSRRQPETAGAIEFIAQEALSHPGAVSIIATGPLTNLARALVHYPHIEPAIASLSIMGGTPAQGNTTPVAEFNAYNDPEALDALLASSIPMYLVGYDLTSGTGLTDHHITRLERSGRRTATFIGQVMRFYRERQMAVTGLEIAPQHDACAVLPYLAPQLVRYSEFCAAVELEGSLTTGMVVFDRRPPALQRSRPSPFADRRPVSLCTMLSAAEVIETIMTAVLAYS
jgi:inosine-uridine nucleoside N-ribohydrolase